MADAATGRVREAVEELVIQVKPGWKEGTKVTFAGKGDVLRPGAQAADIVFRIAQSPHAVFSRSGSDLLVTQPVSLEVALGSAPVTVQGIDGAVVRLPAGAAATALSRGQTVVVPGAGMPISKAGSPGGRGDLRVKLEVRLPLAATDAQRSAAMAALRGCTYDLSRPT